MTVVDAFSARKGKQVVYETWGHLHPEPRRRYRGYIVFAYGTYGDIIILDAEFEDLPDSPWFAMDLQDFILNKIKERGVYRFDGVYMKFKNGGFRFSGKVKFSPASKLKVGER